MGKEPASRTPPTYSALTAKFKNTIRAQTASILDLVEEDVVGLFGDARGALETTSHTKMIYKIEDNVKRPLEKSF